MAEPLALALALDDVGGAQGFCFKQGQNSPSIKTQKLLTHKSRNSLTYKKLFPQPTSQTNTFTNRKHTNTLTTKTETNSTTASMSTTVHVKGISSQTSEKEVRDFFSFW